MANYTTSKGITFDMDQAAQRRRTNVDSRTGTNTSLYNKKNNRSGSSGSSPISGGYDGNSAVLAYLQEIERRQRQAADDAYNRNVAALNDAYAQRGTLLKSNLDSTLQNLQTDYNASKDSVNKDANKSLKEAYINKMMSNKNLAQNMAAQGLSGGASETTMAGMENNYGNARNNIQTVQNENLGNLENLYNQSRNSAYQAYNDQLSQDALTKAQYMTQFENARQSALAAAYDNQISQLLSLDPSYIANMSGLVQSQGSYTPESTSANNSPVSVSVNQGSLDPNSVLNGLSNATRLSYAKKILNNGGTAEDIIQGLSQSTDNNTITQILAQLGLKK